MPCPPSSSCPPSCCCFDVPCMASATVMWYGSARSAPPVSVSKAGVASGRNSRMVRLALPACLSISPLTSPMLALSAKAIVTVSPSGAVTSRDLVCSSVWAVRVLCILLLLRRVSGAGQFTAIVCPVSVFFARCASSRFCRSRFFVHPLCFFWSLIAVRGTHV